MIITIILVSWIVFSWVWFVSQLGKKNLKRKWWELILDTISYIPVMIIAYIVGWSTRKR